MPESKKSETNPSDKLTFEAGFARLEKILEQLNSSQVALEESLNLYREADGLISQLGKDLSQAEKEVTQLIKNRQGELLFDSEEKPKTEPFTDE